MAELEELAPAPNRAHSGFLTLFAADAVRAAEPASSIDALLARYKTSRHLFGDHAQVVLKKQFPKCGHQGYCEAMRNITVSVDDETYRRARIAAAALDSSLSALVKAYLQKSAATETENERLKRQEHEIRRQIDSFTASSRLATMSMGDLCDAAVSRHEHSAVFD